MSNIKEMSNEVVINGELSMNKGEIEDIMKKTSGSTNDWKTPVQFNKPPILFASTKKFDDAEELAIWLKEMYDKYIKYLDDDQIVHIKVNCSKEAYLTLFRTRKPNSKILVDFYKSKAYKFFIENHLANRLWNNSVEGKMTQLRLVLEGMIGVANISQAPGGFTKRKDGCGVLSIIDKGNWTVFQNLAFEFTDPANGISTPKFSASELIDVLSNSQMFSTAPIIEELIQRIENVGTLVRMTLKEWFRTIGRYDLIENYLESPFTLTILVGPEELYLKEMIDENNILNLWSSINFFLSRWIKDGTDVDLHELLHKIYEGDSEKWKVVRRVLSSDKPGTTLLKKVRSLSKACREYVLFPAIALEIAKNNPGFKSSDVYKLFDKYDKIDKKEGVDNNPLMKAYINYIYNKNCNFDLNKAYDFIYKFFDVSKNTTVLDNCKKIGEVFSDLANDIKYIENDKLSDTNLKSMGVSNKGQEDFQFMLMSMAYQIVSKKQSIKTEHIAYILSTAIKTIRGCYDVNKKSKEIIFDGTDIGKKMALMVASGNGSYKWKADFIDELQIQLEKDFDSAYGKGGKNTSFKNREIKNLISLKKEAGFGDAKLKFVFINKEGNIVAHDEDTFISMDWRHIESGMDKYWAGCLWLAAPNRENGQMDDMMLTTKKEAYTKLYDWMKKNQEKYPNKILKMDLLCWGVILEEWSNHFDDNLKEN